MVDRYEVVPEDRRAVFAGPQHATQDPTRRRESKIAQFKLERELKTQLDVRVSRFQPRPACAPAHPRVGAQELRARRRSDEDAEADDDDDVARPIELAVLQLAYLRAHAELASIAQELELLQSSIAMSDLPGRTDGARREGDRERHRLDGDDDDGTWRVEKLEDRTGPMLDPQGKVRSSIPSVTSEGSDTRQTADSPRQVLRPFTILPSSSSSPMATRLRLQSEVFRSGHRLPTMTIDEFLENEEAAGRILQGGGPASSEAVEQERRDQQADREDDTAAGYRKDDLEKDKARKWDEYTDIHRKGEGNMSVLGLAGWLAAGWRWRPELTWCALVRRHNRG